jgi:hypothetical protein
MDIEVNELEWEDREGRPICIERVSNKDNKWCVWRRHEFFCGNFEWKLFRPSILQPTIDGASLVKKLDAMSDLKRRR